MPFGKEHDYDYNPHFQFGGSATELPDKYHFDDRDCTGPMKLGEDHYGEHTGLFFDAKILPRGQFHRFRVIEDTNASPFNFTSPATSLIGCITPPHYPERPFNQGNQPRIFVFAGSGPSGGVCFHPPIHRPIRGCPTSYGWLFEIDSRGTGNYDMTVVFLEGP